ncbi:unnamed protein product [Auanema sp. JU1783]|nr:unnamed protein product [Auanema sp. JU1783]
MSEGSFKTPALPPGGLQSCSVSADPSSSPPKVSNQNEEAKAKAVPVPPLSYTPPPWACEPPESSGYRLEVLKNGSIVDCINLDIRQNQTFITIGRLPCCDVVLDHPSISRYHCILQYGEDIMDKSGKGWHVYDLGSTHGTKTNKRRVPEKQFMRCFVGFVFQFGGSSRLLNLIGPCEDQEAEWEYSPTEMREKMKRKALEAKLATAARKEFEEDQKNDDRDEGINWGMDYGEDDASAYVLDGHLEEDGEAYYVNDPKRALSKFFDREGFEMKFEYSESGAGHTHKWTCSIELPIEIAGVDRACVAQITTNTNKKDAAEQCALEACKILDKHGVLRGTNAKARMKKKTLADNDYYDDDDDLYLDRTGQLEQQREKRKMWAERDAGIAAPPKKDTFESLSKNLEDARAAKEDVQKQLDSLGHTISNKGLESSDSLDDYCRQLSAAGGIKDDLNTKTQKSILRQKLVKLTQECQTLEKLVRIAKPVELPALKTASGAVVDSNKQAFWRKMMMVGRVKKDAPAVAETPVVKATIKNKKSDVFKPEVEEPEEGGSKSNSTVLLPTEASTSKEVKVNESTKDVVEPSSKLSSDNAAESISKAITETSAEPCESHDSTSENIASVPISVEDDNSAGSENKRRADDDMNEDETTSKKRKIRNRPNRQKNQEYGVGCDVKDELYATWLPPTDQSGDGRTKLHDQFGGKY